METGKQPGHIRGDGGTVLVGSLGYREAEEGVGWTSRVRSQKVLSGRPAHAALQGGRASCRVSVRAWPSALFPCYQAGFPYSAQRCLKEVPLHLFTS